MTTFRAWRTMAIQLAIALLFLAKQSLGITLSAPVGGALIPLPEGQVLCGELGGGWIPDPSAAKVRPPLDAGQTGKVTQAHVASTQANCATSKDVIALAATGPIPSVDKRSADLWIDEGRLELKGTNIDGSRLEWETNNDRGSEICVAFAAATGLHGCSYTVSKKLAADPTSVTFRLFPEGAPAKALIYDSSGSLVEADSLLVVPARFILASSLTTERHVDLSTGEARLRLTHPEAIASAECDNGRCELSDREISVRSLSSSVRTVTLKLRLIPRAYVHVGDTFSQLVSMTLEITYCPLALVSPLPFRDTDDVRVVVRVDGHCAANSDGLRWTLNGNNVPILESETKDNAIYALLALGRLSGDRITLAASRGSSDASIIGLVSAATVSPPQLRVSLHLPDFGEIDFIPTNRNAEVAAIAAGLTGQIVTLPVDGAYEVKHQDGRALIRGLSVGGYVFLRFALRDETLPGHLARADLAHFNGYVQRALKEVNVPAPIGVTSSPSPILEVLCSDANGKPQVVAPGVPLHIPFALRDGCRLIIHRERIPIETGEQRMDVEISVTSSGGTSRSDGHISQHLALRHGAEQRAIWIHGVEAQFDRISIRVTHIIDEAQYLRSGGERLEVPAAQWTIVTENTRWRIYGTAAIPVSLFRFSNDPGGAGTGPLTLNLGVLSRATWVTREGKEGVLGLEAGVMGMGLATDTTRQLNIVGGLGMGVPLGNAGQTSQASINIHAWMAYRLGSESAPQLDANGNARTDVPNVPLSHWSFVFGPSVTFGNVGVDL